MTPGKSQAIAPHGSKAIPNTRLQEYVRSSTNKGRGPLALRGPSLWGPVDRFNEDADETERKGKGNDMRQVRGDGDGHAKRTDATKARQEQRDMRADVAPVRINSESPIPAYISGSKHGA